MDASMDLTKLKVADLKKELKIRGLSQAGKRNELLDRLQAGIAAGVGPAEDDGEEEYDEDEILAGDDADDDDSKMTPMEEAAALAAKATATPRGRRTSAVATPRTGQKKLALRRTTSPSLTVPEEPATPAAVTPAKAATPKQLTPKKITPAVKKAAAGATGVEPPSKAIKISNEDDDDDTSNKENGEAHEKTAFEKRSDRFGISSDSEKKEKRNARFGNSKLSKEIVPVDDDTLKARAARFGAVTSKKLLSSEINEKKKARSERFGNGEAETDSASKVDVSSDDVKSKRTDRFAATPVVADDSKSSTPAKLVSASGKKLVTITC